MEFASADRVVESLLDNGNGASPARPPSRRAGVLVQEAYFLLRTFYSDLLDDLHVTDSIVIDGDSLLLELMADSCIDWCSGGQFLHLRWLLESLFSSIAKANQAQLPLYIVFFDGSAGLQRDGASCLARELVSRSLSPLSLRVVRFSAWWGEDWQRWVTAVQPALMLLSDLPGFNGSSDDVPSTQDFLRAQVLHTTALGVQVAYIRELRFTETAMHGFRTAWQSAKREVGAALLADASAVGQAFQAATELAGMLPACPALWLDGMRTGLGAASCALAAQTVSVNLRALFVETWCIHELYLRHLRLADRALGPSDSALPAGRDARPWSAVHAGTRAFVSSLHRSALELLRAQTMELDASMADWFDGRLFACIAAALAAGLPPCLSAQAEAELEQLRGAVRAAAAAVCGLDLVLDGGWAAVGLSSAGGAVTRPSRACALPPALLLPVRGNLLVSAVVSGLVGGSAELQTYPDDSPAVHAAALRAQGSALHQASFHYHSGDQPP